jgi:hypothetical protein
LRSQKKHGVRQPADEHFSDKRNEEIGVFFLALNIIFSLKRPKCGAGRFVFIDNSQQAPLLNNLIFSLS